MWAETIVRRRCPHVQRWRTKGWALRPPDIGPADRVRIPYAETLFRTFFGRVRAGQFHFEDQDDLCKLLMRITVHKTLRQVAFHKAAKRDPSQETCQSEQSNELLMEVLDRDPTSEEA